MTQTPPVAIIILNWNGKDLLGRFLPQILAAADPAVSQVMVADNGSADGSAEFIKEKFPQVSLMHFDTNYGFAEGYNRAVAAVGNPYILLLNSDAAIAPGCDTILYNYMGSHPEAGACQPKLLSEQNHGRFDYAGAAGGYLDKNGYPYCRGRIFSTCEDDIGQYDATADIHWATGAALMVRRSVYMDCGGLDPTFFAHMEEIDLCWRIRLAGWRIAAVTQATAYHLGGASLAAGNPRKTYLNFRNNLLMLHKNLPDASRSRVLLRRRLLDTMAWVQFLLTGKWKHAAALLQAHRDFRKMRKQYTAHPRTDLLGADTDSARDIIADYYLRNRKKYSSL